MVAVEQRFAKSGEQSRKEVPNPFDLPLLKIDHASSRRNVRSVCSKPLILLHRSDFLRLKFFEYTVQQSCSPNSIQCVKTDYGEPARQTGCLLCQDVPSIWALVHLMDGDSCLPVIVKVNPKQGHGATVTREQRGVDVERRAACCC